MAGASKRKGDGLTQAEKRANQKAKSCPPKRGSYMRADERERWGIPDWRDADAYLPTLHDPGFFAWEFLRRSDVYRAAWEDWRETKARCGLSEWAPGKKAIAYGDTCADCWTLTPPALPGETFGQYEDRLGDDVTYTITWAGYRRASEWGIGCGDLLDPCEPGWEPSERGICFFGHHVLAFSTGLVPYHFARGNRNPRLLDQNEVAIYFDLTRNLDDLLRATRIVLEIELRVRRLDEKPRSKLRPDLFPLYLRTFDGRRQGATLEEIASELKADVRNVRAWFKKAEALVGREWRGILDLSPETVPTRKRAKN